MSDEVKESKFVLWTEVRKKVGDSYATVHITSRAEDPDEAVEGMAVLVKRYTDEGFEHADAPKGSAYSKGGGSFAKKSASGDIPAEGFVAYKVALIRIPKKDKPGEYNHKLRWFSKDGDMWADDFGGDWSSGKAKVAGICPDTPKMQPHEMREEIQDSKCLKLDSMTVITVHANKGQYGWDVVTYDVSK